MTAQNVQDPGQMAARQDAGFARQYKLPLGAPTLWKGNVAQPTSIKVTASRIFYAKRRAAGGLDCVLFF
ncbi:hypothetical protein ROLI_027720 [Roseobacter fucihabitans]|uniref:Uncharacterized protein n=1 Tax=Roseobacter fucihabitans TaxID=1537242 RepID=A0ABZ2BWZ0_9RHOB|nr:hypothetical protein [Roseobacter litoralis]